MKILIILWSIFALYLAISLVVNIVHNIREEIKNPDCVD